MISARLAFWIVLFGALCGVAISLGIGKATADPSWGCMPVPSPLWYSPCSDPPPVPGYTPGWTPIDGTPGSWGPRGYEPCKGPCP